MILGCIVKFKDGLYPNEKGAFYRLIEDNGDRVFIKYICNMNFPPISVARTAELEVVELPDIGQENRQDQKYKASQAPRKGKAVAG